VEIDREDYRDTEDDVSDELADHFSYALDFFAIFLTVMNCPPFLLRLVEVGVSGFFNRALLHRALTLRALSGGFVDCHGDDPPISPTTFVFPEQQRNYLDVRKLDGKHRRKSWVLEEAHCFGCSASPSR
jgi:hypothetical protein